MRFAQIVGGFISGVFLVVFYFTIFALVAIPYRIFKRSFCMPSSSNWIMKKKSPATLKGFENEF